MSNSPPQVPTPSAEAAYAAYAAAKAAVGSIGHTNAEAELLKIEAEAEAAYAAAKAAAGSIGHTKALTATVAAGYAKALTGAGAATYAAYAKEAAEAEDSDVILVPLCETALLLLPAPKVFTRVNGHNLGAVCKYVSVALVCSVWDLCVYQVPTQILLEGYEAVYAIFDGRTNQGTFLGYYGVITEDFWNEYQ